MKTNSYDVVIVGAGPAGLMAAKVLAKAGKEVIVLEKNKIVGDKVCAGGLTEKCFTELNLPRSLIEEEFECVDFHIGKRVIKLELGKPWIWTCDRKELGKWQLEQAEKAGAEVRLDSAVVKVEKDRVILKDREEYSFQYLIGADGSNSLVRSFLGVKAGEVGVAIQYQVPREQFWELEFFFDLKRFGPAYAWIFPHAKYASIGAGADPKIIPAAKLKENFDAWCRELNLDPTQYKLQAAPINCDFQGVEFDNVFLAGDASGITSGLTGEGMHPAMVSGEEVAHKILDSHYNFLKLKEILKTKRFEERIVTSYRINKTFARAMFGLGFWLLKRETLRKRFIRFFTRK